jgi:hypothetical protein
MISNYFSVDELQALQELEGQLLKQVVYHNWVNKINPAEQFEFLDKLELVFHNGRIVFAANEDNSGIGIVPDFDGEAARLRLLHEFNGKIDLRSDDMTFNPLWVLTAGKTMYSIELVKDREGLYRNDCLLLNFGEEKLEVRLNMEGLLVEPFEDV